MSANGGITKGKSHKEGGIPMVVKSTGQQVELEGGEGVINKRNMASDKKFEFQGKQMTTCEIASAINSANGNGVKIDCDDVTGKKYAYENGGVVFIGYKDDEIMYEPIDKKYYANDKEFDSLEDAQKFLDSGGINEDLRGAYQRGLFKEGGRTDLFEDYNNIPTEVSAIMAEYNLEDNDYQILEELKSRLETETGYTFNYGLDAEPYGLRPVGVSISELNGYEDYDEEEFEQGGGVESTINYKVGDKIKSFEVKKIVNGYAIKYDSYGNKKRYVIPYLFLLSDNGEERILRADKKSLTDSERYIPTFGNTNKYKTWQMFESAEEFADGGDVRNFSWYQDFKKKPLSEQVKKGTKHEMEHIDTIKQFKKKGVSDKEVAEAIAKDHLSENENYYIELDKMESSKKLSDAINEFEKQKGYKKNTRKYNLGGSMMNEKEVVHLKFTENFDGVIRQKNGKYISESLFPKEKVYKFTFLFNDGKTTALEFGNTGSYMLVPNNIINIVGFNEKFYGNGGSIQPYQSINLDSNDKSILTMLRDIQSPYTATSEQREKLASFKGNNVVNDLSSKMIQKIYGILFKNHNVNNKILNLYLSNIGVGNILLFAPTYLHKTIVSFDEHNQFNQVEKDIANIVTLGKRASLYNDFEMQQMDGIIHIYAETNPEIDMLTELFLKTNKKATALGVCEFTSRQKLNDFQNSIVVNQGKVAQNQMIMFKKSNEYFVINEGITTQGQYTLIYTMTKY